MDYASIENEESESTVFLENGPEASYDGKSVEIRGFGAKKADVDEGKNFRKALNLNLDLLKSVFENALAHVTGEQDVSSQVAPEIHLSFCDLSYSVKQGLRREKKTILKNLHGQFLSGELTAIMGPSGAGKSTLMDILAGFKWDWLTAGGRYERPERVLVAGGSGSCIRIVCQDVNRNGVEGMVKTNGDERDLRVFARQSCYIMQDDKLSPLLTVQEALTLAAHLKLGPSVKRKSEKVKNVLESLGLYNCRKVMSGKLSGGQKKRLAIALELISNPPVMFFDEPTSGLDSSSSKQCISVLKELARSGRTVVCTIHQPSALLFEMFDHIYAVRSGECIYSGGTKGLVPFLSEHGLHCPHYHNPADFMLEVASMSEYVTEVLKLTQTMDGGKCNAWRKRQVPAEERLITQEQKNEGCKKFPAKTSRTPHGTYQTSFWRQFSVLLVTNFKKISRDMFFTYLQIVVHVLFGLLIGLLFYNIGNDAAFVSDNFSLVFFCIMLNMFTSYSAAVSQYPQELPVLIREHFNKWYSLKAYFVATTLSGFPVQVLCSLLYTSIVYYMTAQPLETNRFSKTISIILLVAFVAQGFGYLIASTLNVQNASIFGALLTAPFVLFSGFFVLIPDSPYSMRWLFHLSYFKYALEGLMVAIFGDHRPKMNCSDDYCHFIMPGKFLRQVGMESSDYWFSFGILFAIGVSLRVVTYYCLMFRIKYFKKYKFFTFPSIRTFLVLSYLTQVIMITRRTVIPNNANGI